MGERNVIPFGPQHPVLPEPIHLDLVMEDETVIEAIPSIGFVHRGLEKLVEKKDFIEYVYVAERICGICSFIHSMGYCQAIEQIMKDRTTFIVAHRISTVRNADRIAILDEGRFTEIGAPEELIRNDNFYSRAVQQMQLGTKLI
jgi:NADH:ubiquinone oxidoreductase subunit D